MWLSRVRGLIAVAGMLVSPLLASAIEGLEAPGPDPKFAQELRLFGQLVGDWDLRISNRQDDGSWAEVAGEWHFGWILNGRAIQDVWIAYKPDSKPGDPSGYLGYGTTVRVYDEKQHIWHVNWMGVLTHTYLRFRAHAVGSEIVMDATDSDGTPIQWIFSDIGSDRFLWRSQASPDGGKTWRVDQRMTATRRRSYRWFPCRR